jgi:hypothetical protein
MAGGTWHTINPTPLTLKYVADDPVGTQSWLVQPAAGLADGETPSVVRAKLFDTNGNVAQTGIVVFHIPADLTAVVGGVEQAGPRDVEVPVANGLAQVSLITANYGTYIVTAGIKGSPEDPITQVKDVTETATLFTNGSVPVLFNAGSLSELDSILSIPTAGQLKVVGGTDKHTAQVELVDSNGNPVASTPVTFQLALGDASGPLPDDPATGPITWSVELAPGDPETITWQTVTGAVTDANGTVTVDFSSPQDSGGNHLATWVWVRAHALPAGADPVTGWVGVGQAEVTPVHTQALKGAQFSPGAINPGNTAATFATWTEPVLNNLVDESWARVVVQDDHGNGIGGVDVTFTLPASQTGAAGTPVFVDGATPPASKTITVTSCAYDLSPVPDECKINGVYTPGLAYVSIVSDHEGTFTVTGTVDGGPLGAINAGSGPVTFSAGAGAAEASSFTLDKTDPAAAVVVADGVASYTLTATVMNGQSGDSLKPVSGECVTPQLPAGLSVKSGAQGACPAGSYVTDNAGKAVIEVVSTVAGIAQVGVNLAGSKIPTEAGGDVYLREALFVGGPPSYIQTELFSPAAPARADDPLGQTVMVSVKDEFGNPASCWSADVQVPCEAVFYVPVNTWVGSGAEMVTGPGTVLGYTHLVDYTDAGPGTQAGQATMTYFGIEGIFDVTARVGGQDVTAADGVRDPLNRPAAAHIQFTDATAPLPPEVDPSDGGHVSGSVDDVDMRDLEEGGGGLEVVVKDEDGEEIARCPVKADGTFDCPLVPKQPDGTDLIIVIEDDAGNQTDPPVEITTDGIAPTQPVVDPSQGGTVTGNVDEGDIPDAIGDGGLWVVITDPDDGDKELCRAQVQPDGSFRCDFEPPLQDGKSIDVKIEDPAGNKSDGGRVTIDSTAPAPPTPTPSEGDAISGVGDAAGDKIAVVDKDGTTLCETVVGADLTWQCELDPPLKVGDVVQVVETDPANNQVSRPWRIGVPALTIAKPTVCGGEAQAVTGINFQPGETVTGATSDGKTVGTAAASDQGQVSIKWTVPKGTANNKYTLTATGPLSGAYKVNFNVLCPPELEYTGSDGVVGLAGSALGLLLAGFLMLLAAKRRKRDEEAAA